jgi:hypothetical protein
MKVGLQMVPKNSRVSRQVVLLESALGWNYEEKIRPRHTVSLKVAR